MGKNQKGGKKHKKYKNNSVPLRRELIFADRQNSQEYFTITKMLGDGRCRGQGTDGRSDVLCIIRGSMRKKVWIRQGDVVLGTYRDFESKPVADIIHKYNDDEVLILRKKHPEIFSATKINNIEDEYEPDAIGFTFEDL